MNRLCGLSLILTLLLLGSACSQKNKMDKQITALENEIFSDQEQSVNMEKTAQLVDAYVAFADSYPSDTEAPEHLFNAGNVAMNLLDPEKAITLFDRIMKSYPEFEKIPHCLFLKAFIYENQLNQLGSAEMLYREFLQKYPDHEFTDDAEMSLKNLGKTPEELLEQFQMAATKDDTL
ncbi:MAG TPA: tetratricopeptide repeat protein [Bacteroidales bacterium]|nr:tetratricopeptide repeat protein [Bacteroidales bacterium]HNS47494.1 tetratricopeptide repeat protein [Bacteroidales bacterium]